jgi:hypothetical protein
LRGQHTITRYPFGSEHIFGRSATNEYLELMRLGELEHAAGNYARSHIQS